jgi:hypothetical protein
MAVTALVTGLSTIGVFTTGDRHFYADDPLWVDDDAALDASKAGKIEDANSYDFVVNSFGTPGERQDVRALNVNTIGEVPDSSWFTNRIGKAGMSVADIRRGPDRYEAISLDSWTVSGGKGAGVQPGFRMTDPEGHTYQIEFDPPSNPELATGAEIIGTAFYHAFGYHTVEVYLAELDPDRFNPVIDFALSENGELTFENAVERAGVAPPATSYRVTWARFDNSTGATSDLGGPTTVRAPRAQAPDDLMRGERPEFLEVRVATVHPQFPSWEMPVTVHFQRLERSWKLVGVTRLAH